MVNAHHPRFPKRHSLVTSTTFSSAHFKSAIPNPRPNWDIAILACLVIATRIPLLGIAEPDSALFTTGVRQWLQGGPHAVAIYSAQACGLYYAVVAALVRHLHLYGGAVPKMMGVLSLGAGLAVTIFGYLIGVRFAGSRAAFRAMLLFVLAPGFWWITVESHPQAISIAFAVAAIWSFLRHLEERNIWFLAGAAVSFGLAIAIKNDAVLLLPALLAVALWVHAAWPGVFKAVLVGVGGGALGTGLVRLTADSPSGAVASGARALTTFWRVPKPFDVLREGSPIIFGLGLVTAAVLGVTLIVAMRRDPERRQWLAVLTLWCLPGYLFWLFVSGNDVRHVVAFGLPLFWLSAKYLNMTAVIGCIAVSLLVPGNSNVFMFPSPNVPDSARLFAQKQTYLVDVAKDLSKQPSCFIGSYTSDYLVNILLDRGGRIDGQRSATDTSAASVTMPNHSVITFERNSTSQKTMDLGACRSVEYNTEGRKVRLFGGEWHVPIV